MSNRVMNEVMAVNEETGDIVQVTEGGFIGRLNVARKSMKLYLLKQTPLKNKNMREIVEVDLEKLFKDCYSKNCKKCRKISKNMRYAPNSI